jgi:hypothetical protein
VKYLRIDPKLHPHQTPVAAWRLARSPARFTVPPSRYGAFIARVARRAILPK